MTQVQFPSCADPLEPLCFTATRRASATCGTGEPVMFFCTCTSRHSQAHADQRALLAATKDAELYLKNCQPASPGGISS